MAMFTGLRRHLDPLRLALVRAYRNRHSYPLARYDRWARRYNRPSADDALGIRDHIESGALPHLQIVWLLPRDDSGATADAVASLVQQDYPHWTAVFVTPPGSAATEAGQIADSRIRSTRADFADVADSLPTLFIHEPVVLDRLALYHFACAHAAGLRIAYADEDRLSRTGRRSAPLFKSAFSPIDLPHRLPLGACFMVVPGRWTTEELARASWRGGSALAEAKAELLRAADPGEVGHIPYILFSLGDDRAQDPHPVVRPAIEPAAGEWPTVTIIIPTRDRIDLIVPCMESLCRLTRYPSEKLQIIVVDNQSSDAESCAYLDALARSGQADVLRYDAPFNYSRINNLAAASARGDVLVFLNNDVVIDRVDWLELLVGMAVRPEVGVVGGKLLYADRTVQHAGVVLGIQGLAIHAFRHLKEADGGYMELANRTRAISAVTGACAAIRRSVFIQIGGFDEDLAVAFNDVSLCIAAMRSGLTNICLGEALLLHLESKSRGLDDTPVKRARAQQEGQTVRARHDRWFRQDPFYNPNLCVRRPYHLAMVPRRPRPWVDFRRRREGACSVLILTDHAETEVGQVSALAGFLRRAGHKVVVGGRSPAAAHADFPSVRLGGVRQAAHHAFFEGVDCIVALSSPYFSVARHLAAGQLFVAASGERRPSWIERCLSSSRRRDDERALCQSMADMRLASPSDWPSLARMLERLAEQRAEGAV